MYVSGKLWIGQHIAYGNALVDGLIEGWVKWMLKMDGLDRCLGERMDFSPKTWR